MTTARVERWVLFGAIALWMSGFADGAAASQDQETASPRALLDRGMSRYQAGDLHGSLDDFDRVAALAPDSDPHLWQRGIVHYQVGLYREGREQFERHQTVNGNDVENSTWHYLCTARELGLPEAKARYLPIPRNPDGSHPDRRVPMEQVDDLYAGRGSAEAVLAAAGDERNALCYAHLYLGLHHEAAGRADEARRHLQLAATTYAMPHYMGAVATLHFERLHPDVTFVKAPRGLAEHATVEDWPCLLGARRDSTTAESPLRTQWPETGPPVVWEMKAGTGYAPPIAVDGQLVLAHRIGGEVRLECLEVETGAKVWSFSTPTTFRSEVISNSGPRGTPVWADGRVYVHIPGGQLFALDASTGDVVWTRDISSDANAIRGFFGAASTPLALDGRLIVNVGGRGGPSVVALNGATGETAWEAEANAKEGEEWAMSCASPVAAMVDGASKVVVFTGGKTRPARGGVLLLDATTGKVEGKFPWRSRSYQSVNASTPVIVGSQAFVSASYDTGTVALDLANGLAERWRDDDFGLQFVNAVHRDGFVYAFDASSRFDSALACLDWNTGKTQWREAVPLPDRQRMGDASLLAISDGFLALSDGGTLVSLALNGEGMTMRARASLFNARESWSPPVVHRGLLLIRQNNRSSDGSSEPRLICYDLRGDG